MHLVTIPREQMTMLPCAKIDRHLTGKESLVVDYVPLKSLIHSVRCVGADSVGMLFPKAINYST